MEPREYKDYTLPEISIRLTKSEVHTQTIRSSQDVANLFTEIYDDSIGVYESMFVVYLNKANKTIGWMRVSQGGLSGTVIDSRLILSAGLKCLASGMIICHNHPSGNKRPSEADMKITIKVKKAGELVQIKLLDHVILTESDGYFSFADEGLLIN